MYPILLQFGSLTFHSYGLFIGLAIVVGYLVNFRLCISSGIDVSKHNRLAVLIVFFGVLGTKLMYMLVNIQTITLDNLLLTLVSGSGLVWYGAPLLVIPLLFFYCRKIKVPVWRFLDALMPAVVIAQSVGRIGCFLGGCCYGLPTDSPLGIQLMNSPYFTTAEKLIFRHPVQIYDSMGMFILFLVLMFVFKSKRRDGDVFLVYVFGYAFVRSVVELFRGDAARGIFFNGLLSTSQLISIGMFVVGLILLWNRHKFLAETDVSPRV